MGGGALQTELAGTFTACDRNRKIGRAEMNIVPFGGGGRGPDDPALERRVLILERKMDRIEEALRRGKRL
jgi:hypothetical protein